jgi:hypothetical protein
LVLRRHSGEGPSPAVDPSAAFLLDRDGRYAAFGDAPILDNAAIHSGASVRNLSPWCSAAVCRGVLRHP